jgi:hypothetical protein
VCSLASAAARVAAASISTRSFSNTHSIYGEPLTVPAPFAYATNNGQHHTDPDNTCADLPP